jgi:hypothetical protein
MLLKEKTGTHSSKINGWMTQRMSVFGYFVDGDFFEWSLEGDGIPQTEVDATQQTESCNDVGEVVEMNLQDLQLSGLKPSLPPEIALLTSLTHIALYLNELEVSLQNLFPTELYLMSSLEEIWLCTNNVSSYISSDMGLLTNMKILEVNTNSLFGPLPSELGLMTSLQLLDLHNNGFTGSVPHEIWQNSALTKLELSNLPLLTGSIPTDLPFLAGMRYLNLTGIPGLYGTIPEGWCFLQEPSCTFVDVHGENVSCSLEFDCTERLCGCNCPCSNLSIGGGAHNNYNGTQAN